MTGAWFCRRGFWDVLFVAGVAAGGFLIGSRYVAAFQAAGHADFGQPEFAAAVMLTCGRGFTSPMVSTPALDNFLAGHADAFSCDQLTERMTAGGVSFTQRLYRYLMTAVAWQWKWSGISWSRLTPLFGIVFAATLCAAYGIFRLAGNPLVAVLGVAPLAVSAHHLGYLPQLRDYAKAPFILLLILIVARLAMPPLGRRRALLLAAAFGLVLGIGFGFRNDLLISIPPFVMCVVFLLPGRWRDNLRLKGACLATALIVFVLSAWPILSGYRSGSNTGHVAVLGLTSTFDAPLGLTRPIYNLGPHYLDGFATTMVNEYSRLRDGTFVEYTKPDYDAAAVQFIRDVARHWPADMLVRGLASARRVLEFPFTVGTLTNATPYGLTAPWAVNFYTWQQHWLRRLAGVGVWAALLTVIVLGGTSRRAGIAVGLLLLYYAGYPAVQFSIRHYFHLEFIVWWALAFLIVRTVRLRSITLASVNNAAMTAAILGVVVAAPLLLLRIYQQRHVTVLIDDYLRAPRTALSLSRTPAADGTTVVSFAGLWSGHNAADPVDARYLALEFTADRCGATNMPVTVKYDARTEANDFTYTARVGISPAAPTLRLIPAYYNGTWSHFSGFVIPARDADCLKAVSRVDDMRGTPLLLDLELEPDWKATRLFQQIAH